MVQTIFLDMETTEWTLEKKSQFYSQLTLFPLDCCIGKMYLASHSDRITQNTIILYQIADIKLVHKHQTLSCVIPCL